MTHKDEMTEQVLRQFLLGNVDDAQRERIETLFITQSVTRQQLLIVEQDLIEDYLDDLLTSPDKARFLQRYAESRDQQRKLRIASLVQDWARNPQPDKNHSLRMRAWMTLPALLRFQRAVVIPMIATVIIALVIAGIWLNNRKQRERHLTTEQELARLNSPSAVLEVSDQTISTTVGPVTVRDAAAQHDFKLSPGIRVVEVRLLWIQKENYTRYRAIIRRFDGAEAFTVDNLQARKQVGVTISVRLPAEMFTAGVYQISLSGIATDGTVSPAEEYRFAVDR